MHLWTVGEPEHGEQCSIRQSGVPIVDEFRHYPGLYGTPLSWKNARITQPVMIEPNTDQCHSTKCVENSYRNYVISDVCTIELLSLIRPTKAFESTLFRVTSSKREFSKTERCTCNFDKWIRREERTDEDKRSGCKTYPLSSISCTLVFRLLNAKHDFTLIPYIPVNEKDRWERVNARRSFTRYARSLIPIKRKGWNRVRDAVYEPSGREISARKL